jgi:hypothetical protein
VNPYQRRLKPGVTGYAGPMAHGKNKVEENRKNRSKNMFTKTSKMGHFLVLMNFLSTHNQHIESCLCLASGGGVNT